MTWLFRPSTLILVTAVLAVGAAVLLVWPWWEGPAANRALPRPVPQGDQEIVWLNPATSQVAWDRFMTAIRLVLAEQGEAGWQLDETNASPLQTTAAPEVALWRPGSKGRLWFRWYKLTGDLKIANWVDALARRRPPPLAIIGGGSSDRALELARTLQAARQHLGDATPLLLITTATIDDVLLADEPIGDTPLNAVYDRRTFRFCFTNRQMADAVSDFLWSQDDLRPNADPVYVVAWQDDPYSVDLAGRFREVAWKRRDVKALARDELHPSFWSINIPHSVGPFNQPNREEAQAARRLMDELSRHPEQRRPWLVLPAAAQPARRFLRALLANAPAEASRFVVATGDSIDFNTIYRDRTLTWPIQELPCSLVLFFHRNPIDEAAFTPDLPTGTEDLLLYADIVSAVTEAAFAGNALLTDANQLALNLRQSHSGRFDANGNRPSGMGEYVVCLRPVRSGDRLLPEARLQVWRAEPGRQPRWQLVRELALDYTQREFAEEQPPRTKE